MASLLECRFASPSVDFPNRHRDLSSCSSRLGHLATQLPACPRLLVRKPHVAVRATPQTDGTGTRVTDPVKQEPGRVPGKDEFPSASSSGSGSGSFLDSDEEVSSIMEGVSFSQLCDDFECISSPALERTARQLAKDIHDLKEDKRSLSCFAINVKFKDPLRSFTGRDKFRRPSWILSALDRPRVTMISMEMTSNSELVIKWRLRGAFRVAPGDLDLLVTANYTLNQISGQVTEERDEWDLSRCPLPGAVAFYSSRLAWSTVQSSKDLQDFVKSVTDKKESDNSYFMPDPSGDPKKFFVQDDPNKELYQFAFGVALVYLLVQFLQQVL